MSWTLVSGSEAQLSSLLSVMNIFNNKCSLKIQLTAVYTVLMPKTDMAGHLEGGLQQLGSHHVSPHLLFLAR